MAEASISALNLCGAVASDRRANTSAIAKDVVGWAVISCSSWASAATDGQVKDLSVGARITLWEWARASTVVKVLDFVLTAREWSTFTCASVRVVKLA